MSTQLLTCPEEVWNMLQQCTADVECTSNDKVQQFVTFLKNYNNPKIYRSVVVNLFNIVVRQLNVTRDTFRLNLLILDELLVKNIQHIILLI